MKSHWERKLAEHKQAAIECDQAAEELEAKGL